MEAILTGFFDAFSLGNVVLIAAGVLIGITVGAIPGLSAPLAIAVAVPLTFYMSPLTAIAFLVGINKGGTFGGSITAILFNTPGSPEAAATTFDGYPLTRRGESGKALKTALYSSVFGEMFSDVVVIFAAVPLAILALSLGPPEIALVAIFALVFIASLIGHSLLKGLVATAAGLFISTIGLDPETALPRMTLGLIELYDGVPLIPLAIGLFVLSEVMDQAENAFRSRQQPPGANADGEASFRVKIGGTLSAREFFSHWRTLIRSSAIGTGIGALPAIGAVTAGLIGYGAAKRASKTPEAFGRGAIEGVAAAESSACAVAGASLVPLLVLGIPGSVSAILLIGAFTIHGLAPGPLLFREHAELVYGLFASLLIANVCNLVLGSAGLHLFARLAAVPMRYMRPTIILFCFTGAYLASNSMFGVAIMLVFGVVGYFMRKLDYSYIAFAVGFVLGPVLELALRQSVILFSDRPFDLLTRPVSIILACMITAAVARYAYRAVKNKPEEADAQS